MAPRRKTVATLRSTLNNASDKENNYLRTLSDYQARVRRRESIRNCKHVAEYDLDQKIALEIKIKEGSSRLLAAARHPAQCLEAARTLFTSNKKMSAYMAELQSQRKDSSSCASKPQSTGELSISDLRFPLMWRDSDHFKNRGDHRRFAVFCIAKVGAEVQDTGLIYPIDREQTDISFPDILSFHNVSPKFELILEVYSHMLQEDLSIASTQRRIRRTIHSSISKTVGRKLIATLRDGCELGKTPQFDLVARARMTLDDTDTNTRSYDLSLSNSSGKGHALPLFGHFCCRLAVQPHYVVSEACDGLAIVNNQRCWIRLQGFQIEAWLSTKCLEEAKKPLCTIAVNKETTVHRVKSLEKQLRIINNADGNERCDVLELNTNEDIERWLKELKRCIDENTRWKHAAIGRQRIPGSDNQSANTGLCDRLNDKTERSKSLYDETPLIEPALPNIVARFTVPMGSCKSASEYHRDSHSILRPCSGSKISTLSLKYRAQISDETCCRWT